MNELSHETKMFFHNDTDPFPPINFALTSKLNITEIHKMLINSLLELVPGFIHDLNNLLGVVDNYREIHSINEVSYIRPRNLNKVFDNILCTNKGTRNFLSILRKDASNQSLKVNQFLNRILNIFKYKFIEKKIAFKTDFDIPYFITVHPHLSNCLFINMLNYLVNVASGDSEISLSAKENKGKINFIFMLKCLLTGIKLKPNIDNSGLVSHEPDVEKKLAFCNETLAKIGIDPIEIHTEKKGLTSHNYILTLDLPITFFEVSSMARDASGKGALDLDKSDKKKAVEPASILIIDDEKMMCDLLVSIFEEDDYKLDYAFDAEEGLRKFRSSNYDVVICDYILPGATAKDIVKKIKEINKKSKVIIITGCEDQSLERDLLKPPVYAILHKPFKIDDIVSMVSELI